jgi:hypothetical protein
MTQRVVYNSCFGGFGLHEDAVKWVRDNKDRLREQYDNTDVSELTNTTLSGEFYDDGSGPKEDWITSVKPIDLSRNNELLADIVSGETEYTGTVNGQHADLRVTELPDSVDYTIDEYDGNETVKEQYRTFS